MYIEDVLWTTIKNALSEKKCEIEEVIGVKFVTFLVNIFLLLF